MRFTPEQTLAIERRRGELLLDAGAGSGKTSVLVERFARAVKEDGIAVGQILTITFTEKAAAELRERIRTRLRAVGDDEAARATEGAWISTIHAFCARVLRTHALAAGLDPEFTVLDENDTAALRRAAFDAALTVCARTDPGADLIGAHGPPALRRSITSIYDELRARGQLDPTLPPAPLPPSELDAKGIIRLVQELALLLLRELGQKTDPGKRVSEAIEQLEAVPGVLAHGLPWPGELQRITLGSGAAALKSQACKDYRSALQELSDMAAEQFAYGARDALDALLRTYGERYTALKHRQSGLDFTDLELLARDLLKRQDIGNSYRERFARVMVDEMQDTNSVQLELIDLVAGLDLFMVGDAQQSIYGFRHADVDLFEERGARLERIGGRASLQTNFRSRPEILMALNGAFGIALGAGFRPLLPGREDEKSAEPAVELLIVDKEGVAANIDPELEPPGTPWRISEARALAARIRELLDAGETRAGDVVVLIRATTDMHIYEQALEQAGVPTYVIGGRGYWAHPQVIELVAYLRALANPLDTEALYTVFLSPLCGLSLDGLVLGDAAAPDELSDDDREKLERFDAWFRVERRAATWVGPEQLLDRALARSGYDAHLAGLPDGRRRLANVRKLMRLAREWQTAHGSDLRGFVDTLQARTLGGDGGRESEAPVESEALDAVRLMTIHRSKGLEFPVVCVADLGRQMINRSADLVRVARDGVSLGLRLKRPGFGERINALAYNKIRAEQWELELAEERRLFYVAMTRARDRLIISGAAKLAPWDEANTAAPIGWVGAALVPDLANRATAAAAVAAVPGVVGPPPAFVTALGVRVSFVTVPDQGARDAVDIYDRIGHKRRPSSLARPVAAVPPVQRAAPPATPVRPATPGPPRPPGPPAPRPPVPASPPAPVPDLAPAAPQIATLSYTALATYERCGYRFYAERVLGLPERPPIPLPPEPDDSPVPQRPTMSGSARGTLIHELLARLDFKRPSLADSMPAEVRGALTGLLGSSTFARLAGLRDVRREQRFAFPAGQTLITGVFDVLAREDRFNQLLVVDYKSDRLGGVSPYAIVDSRYQTQRTIYALAALKLGAATVEVLHLFLEAPEDPVAAVFQAADAPTLEADLLNRVVKVSGSDFPVTDAPGRQVCDGCPAQGGLCSYPLEVTSGLRR
jgi:ATP-dependent helicase/nuclease subunit A